MGDVWLDSELEEPALAERSLASTIGWTDRLGKRETHMGTRETHGNARDAFFCTRKHIAMMHLMCRAGYTCEMYGSMGRSPDAQGMGRDAMCEPRRVLIVL